MKKTYGAVEEGLAKGGAFSSNREQRQFQKRLSQLPVEPAKETKDSSNRARQHLLPRMVAMFYLNFFPFNIRLRN